MEEVNKYITVLELLTGIPSQLDLEVVVVFISYWLALNTGRSRALGS